MNERGARQGIRAEADGLPASTRRAAEWAKLTPRRRHLLAVTALLLTLVFPLAVTAHDVPADVTIVAFVRPAADRLLLVVRLPAAAISASSVLFGGLVLPTRGDGAVDQMRAEQPLADAARIIASLLPLYENERSLTAPEVTAARLSQPDDRSFVSYDAAVAHLTGTGPAGTGDAATSSLEPGRGFFDTILTYRVASDRSDFSLEPRVVALAQRVTVAVRFLPVGDSGVRAYQVTADTGRFRLDPRWYSAALGFVATGFVHILDGTDHLLFLLCLVIPFRRWQSLIPVVTAFTVAHSITLVASAFGLAPSGAWFVPLIETLIAGSIVYMAVENVFVDQPRHRWLTTFAFGLAHGFGFSFALRESLQFAGSHLFTSLLSFNIGVELGQVFVLAIAGPALPLLFSRIALERLARMVLSIGVAHVGWHWLLERGDGLMQIASWPTWAGAGVPGLLAVIVGASLLRVAYLAYCGRLFDGAGDRSETAIDSRAVRAVAGDGAAAR